MQARGNPNKIPAENYVLHSGKSVEGSLSRSGRRNETGGRKRKYEKNRIILIKFEKLKLISISPFYQILFGPLNRQDQAHCPVSPGPRYRGTAQNLSRRPWDSRGGHRVQGESVTASYVPVACSGSPS